MYRTANLQLLIHYNVKHASSVVHSSGWPGFLLRLRNFSLHPGVCSTVLRSREFNDVSRASDDNY